MMMPWSVLVLDAATLEIKQEIPVGDMPAEITLSPDGRSFYVANGESDSVTVIDAATKQVVRTVAVGDNPVGAWQATTEHAYVDNETGMTVSALNRRTLSVTSIFDLGFMPGMARLGQDGHLWVTDADNGRVVLFLLDTVERHEIPTADGAHGIAFAAGGRTAYITNQMADTVSVIDVRSRQVVKTLSVGRSPTAWCTGQPAESPRYRQAASQRAVLPAYRQTRRPIASAGRRSSSNVTTTTAPATDNIIQSERP